MKLLLTEAFEVVKTFPDEFSGEAREVKEFLTYICYSLVALEETGTVELSNATIHALLFLWAHSRIK
jgi:hypothetical protein